VSATHHDVIALSDYVYGRTRRRLDGLTDDEYLWEPVPGCWSVRPDAAGELRADRGTVTGDAPFTTIAWRLWHLVNCYAETRYAHWLGVAPGPEGLGHTDPAPATAAEAVACLERAHSAWRAMLTALPEEQWIEPLGPIAGPFGTQTKAAFVLHQIDEQIHHGAELGVLRDLYRTSYAGPGPG
jgi:uncharacterized damage-inducible protein DinB